MGVSTDGILFYGAHLPEITENVVRLLCLDPDEEYDEWELMEELCKKYGLSFGAHCSYDYPVFYVYIKQYSASRGYPEKIINQSILKEDTEKLKLLLKDLDIEEDQIGWWLASMWG